MISFSATNMADTDEETTANGKTSLESYSNEAYEEDPSKGEVDVAEVM